MFDRINLKSIFIITCILLLIIALYKIFMNSKTINTSINNVKSSVSGFYVNGYDVKGTGFDSTFVPDYDYALFNKKHKIYKDIL